MKTAMQNRSFSLVDFFLATLAQSSFTRQDGPGLASQFANFLTYLYDTIQMSLT